MTFWSDPKVADQAREVFTMLHKGQRRIGRNDVAIRLRFHGYRIAPDVVRSALIEILANRIAKMREPEDEIVGPDPIWDHVPRWAGQWALEAGVSRQIRDEMADLMGEIIQLVCRGQDELPVGIGDLWGAVTPYVDTIHDRSDGDQQMNMYDAEYWEWIVSLIRQYLSMPYQLQAVIEASDRDIVAAFRFLWGAAGLWKKLFEDDPGAPWHPGFRRIVDEFAPFILTTTITVMKEPSVHSGWRKFLIDLSRYSRQDRSLKSRLKGGYGT